MNNENFYPSFWLPLQAPLPCAFLHVFTLNNLIPKNQRKTKICFPFCLCTPLVHFQPLSSHPLRPYIFSSIIKYYDFLPWLLNPFVFLSIVYIHAHVIWQIRMEGNLFLFLFAEKECFEACAEHNTKEALFRNAIL
jgi:hypothetical protein